MAPDTRDATEKTASIIPGTVNRIGTADFSDMRTVHDILRKSEDECIQLPYEVNTTVTRNGTIWRVFGTTGGFVNPFLIPDDLTGSYSYHNHPEAKTNYSFSAEDVAFLFRSKSEYMKASDHLFEYELKRTKMTVDKSPEWVYHRFKEISKSADIRRLLWDGLIDPDMDVYHETMIYLSKELKINYVRRKKKTC